MINVNDWYIKGYIMLQASSAIVYLPAQFNCCMPLSFKRHVIQMYVTDICDSMICNAAVKIAKMSPDYPVFYRIINPKDIDDDELAEVVMWGMPIDYNTCVSQANQDMAHLVCNGIQEGLTDYLYKQ